MFNLLVKYSDGSTDMFYELTKREIRETLLELHINSDQRFSWRLFYV